HDRAAVRLKSHNDVVVEHHSIWVLLKYPASIVAEKMGKYDVLGSVSPLGQDQLVVLDALTSNYHNRPTPQILQDVMPPDPFFGGHLGVTVAKSVIADANNIVPVVDKGFKACLNGGAVFRAEIVHSASFTERYG